MSEHTTAQLLADARDQLTDVRQDGLGRDHQSRWRGRRIRRAGSAWHLGVLLLTDTDVFATAEIVRAADAGRRGYAAESARARANRRMEAIRGGFVEGEIVHVGWTPIDVDAVDAGGSSGPLAMIEGSPSVQWSAAAGFMPLDAYLREQIALLHP